MESLRMTGTWPTWGIMLPVIQSNIPYLIRSRDRVLILQPDAEDRIQEACDQMLSLPELPFDPASDLLALWSDQAALEREVGDDG